VNGLANLKLCVAAAGMAIACWGWASGAGWVRGVALSSEGKQLTISTEHGETNAPLLEGQVGFSKPGVSAGRSHVGWLALYQNCCTSYAIPMELVVMSQDGSVTRFEGQQATFGWCFSDKGKDLSVVYMRSPLHGGGVETFEMRRVRDGALLKRYERSIEIAETNAEPDWLRCAL
jgi:hypothetical protein